MKMRMNLQDESGGFILSVVVSDWSIYHFYPFLNTTKSVNGFPKCNTFSQTTTWHKSELNYAVLPVKWSVEKRLTSVVWIWKNNT
jgi:hypothetical protein